MKLVDLNLLLHAINRDSAVHEPARVWVAGALTDPEPLALAWSVVLGFVRITTRRGAFACPLAPEAAFEIVEGWLRRPGVVLLNPGDRHWTLVRQLLERSGTAGNLTTDAHLAALALEYDATLYSTDHDFARFRPALRFVNPLAD